MEGLISVIVKNLKVTQLKQNQMQVQVVQDWFGHFLISRNSCHMASPSKHATSTL
jgi:hypothetical protein